MEREIAGPSTIKLDLPLPQQNEKLGAVAVHIGDIFLPILFPLGALLFARKKSEYVYSHARQAIVEALWIKAILGVAILASLSFTFSGLWEHYQEGWVNWDWQGELVRFGIKAVISWAVLWIFGVINTVLSAIHAVQAFQGVWPKFFQKRAAKANRL